jgi:outer membrane immunogenic protein
MVIMSYLPLMDDDDDSCSRKWGTSAMKQTWFPAVAVIALIGTSSGAIAADLGRPPPAPPPIMPLFYNWSGFYIGANVGGAWASGTLTDNLTGASFTGNHSGVIGGGTIGYNWQVAPMFVLGVEGTFDGTSIGKTSTTVGTPIGAIQGSAGTNWVSTVAARFGIAQNNWLFYGKAGGGWADNTASLTNLVTGGSVSASNTTGGWLVGGGIEYGLTNNWTIKAEYDYLGLSHWTAASPFLPGDSINLARQINMFTVGVNYKF